MQHLTQRAGCMEQLAPCQLIAILLQLLPALLTSVPHLYCCILCFFHSFPMACPSPSSSHVAECIPAASSALKLPAAGVGGTISL